MHLLWSVPPWPDRPAVGSAARCPPATAAGLRTAAGHGWRIRLGTLPVAVRAVPAARFRRPARTPAHPGAGRPCHR
ncbi:hypothetical protein FRAHR75_110003 [Frankia sp. Hr75.2]|nr:hypothetical protein FRAHR75_110003 [Frankia sp. Hr75.2]